MKVIFISMVFLFSSNDGVSKDNCAHSNSPAYKVCPSVLRDKSGVSISLPKNHLKQAGVITPGGDFIYLVYGEFFSGGFENFQSLDVVNFSVPKLSGIIYVDGKKSNRKVFIEPGKYIFYFADSLDTEPDNPISEKIEIMYSK